MPHNDPYVATKNTHRSPDIAVIPLEVVAMPLKGDLIYERTLKE
jgi:hypothetical protein